MKEDSLYGRLYFSLALKNDIIFEFCKKLRSACLCNMRFMFSPTCTLDFRILLILPIPRSITLDITKHNKTAHAHGRIPFNDVFDVR